VCVVEATKNLYPSLIKLIGIDGVMGDNRNVNRDLMSLTEVKLPPIILHPDVFSEN
jgi:hypothetical protein